MTLYLKYRPQKISELDLEEVKRGLSRTLQGGKTPHAFLFSGPKGSGKTSAARILAKVLNCEKNKKGAKKKRVEPCNRCTACREITLGSSLDVIEMDAASYRGIDDVRAIRETVRLSPAKSPFKVYIIDEAHMLTAEAFNALLKTLEEPPSHVIFILATTQPAKIPETIKSRCVQFRFSRAKQDEVIHALQRVVRGEKLKVGKDVLREIARHADGSFRDAIKTLEQVVAAGKPTPETVREVVGTSSDPLNREFLLSLRKKDSKKALKWLQKMAEGGADFRVLNESILGLLHAYLLQHFGVEEEGVDLKGFDQFSSQELKTLVALFSQAAGELKTSPIPQLPLELAVIEWCEGEPVLKAPNPRSQAPATSLEKEKEDEKESKEKPAGKKSSSKEITNEVWGQVLQEVKPRNHSVEALLRATRPSEFDGRTLTLEVFYKFHKERLEQETYRRIVEEATSQILQRRVRIVCLLSEKPNAASVREDRPQKETSPNLEPVVDEDIIKAAKEIFGGKLVD